MLQIPAFNNESIKQFFAENKPLVLRLMVRRIRRAIYEKKDKIEIFKFSNTNNIAACEKSSYPVVLNEAMQSFVENEMYEDAAICRDLLNHIKCDDISKNS